MAVVGFSLCIWIIYNIVSGVMRLAGGQVSTEEFSFKLIAQVMTDSLVFINLSPTPAIPKSRTVTIPWLLPLLILLLSFSKNESLVVWYWSLLALYFSLFQSSSEHIYSERTAERSGDISNRYCERTGYYRQDVNWGSSRKRTSDVLLHIHSCCSDILVRTQPIVEPVPILVGDFFNLVRALTLRLDHHELKWCETNQSPEGIHS